MVGIQRPSTSDEAAAVGSRRASTGSGGAMGRQVAATVTNSSPPTLPSPLPSAASAMAAVSSLSNTLSSLPSLTGFVGRPAAPPVDASPNPAAPEEARGVWTGGAFDRLPARWQTAQVETALILHTASSVSIFAFPPSSGRAGPQLKEALRLSAANLGGGTIVGARVVPPSTITGTDWALVVVTEMPGAGRLNSTVSLLSLPSLTPIASRPLAGSLAAVKSSSHCIAISTLQPPALHILHPRTLESALPTLVPPALALDDDDLGPVFDVRGRLVVYASAEPAGKAGAPVLRSSAGSRKLEEGAAGLSRLARSRRSDAGLAGHPTVETERPAIGGGSSRRPSMAVSKSARSVVVLSTANPHDRSPPHLMAHFSCRGVSMLSLSPSSSKLLLSTTTGHHSFSILALRPPGAASLSKEASLWETHVLHRGLTPARLEGVAWSDDEKWLGSKTARGTTHLWLIDPNRQGLSEGRDVSIRVRQPPTPEGGLELGLAFVPGHGGTSASQDLVIFDATDGQHVSLRRLVPPRASSATKDKPPPLPPSQGSALSLMISASRKAQALVAASTSSILEGSTHGEGSQWEVARWEVGNLLEETDTLPLELLAGPEPRPPARDAIALALSNAEIETSTPSLRVLAGPLYLSHQFSFSTFDTSVVPAKVPLLVSEVPTQRLIVRAEVVVSRSPALDPVPSLSSSVDSFNEPLSSAMGSPLGVDPRDLAAKPIIPSYPNGDGLTTSPRSWKSSAVGLPILVGARSLGDGLIRVRHEVGRITSPSGSFSSRQLRGRPSASKSSAGGGLSFEDGVVYDPSDFRQPSVGSDSFGPSSSSTDPDEPWEDDDDEAEERYRALVEEEATFDDLVLGVMDEDDGREVGAFGAPSDPRSTSVLGLGALSLKTPATAQLVPASLPVPHLAAAANVEPDEAPVDTGALTKDQRKALNKARKRAARGSSSSPATPPSGASSLAIARSTSTTGHEDGSKHTPAT